MNDDTIELLKECNSGCKNTTDSMEQVLSYTHDANLKALITKYNKKHVALGDKCHVLLNNADKSEKDPSMMAKVFSKLSTDAKLMMNDDAAKIADLMVDGCNMGIKSISKVLNQCLNASSESVGIANELIGIEKDFMNELLAYM